MTESAITAASVRFVAEHRDRATELGRELADHLPDAPGFAARLREAFVELADPAYAEGIHSVTPGLGAALGVRQPLMSAVHSGFRARTRRVSSAIVLDAAERLIREDVAELRWFAIWLLNATVSTDPERSWQLMRRIAREAGEWVTVDTLAHTYVVGILTDSRRWAEVEQFIYSPSRWERRLVGSTIAEMPFARGLPNARSPEVASRGLELIGQLIGDAEPDVQKALSWALRSLVLVDAPAVERFARLETATAVATDDGQRAWVIRDALAKLPIETAGELRGALAGLRRRPGGASTSKAAAISSAFLDNLPASPVAAAN